MGRLLLTRILICSIISYILKFWSIHAMNSDYWTSRSVRHLLHFNPCLEDAYFALQAWKCAITSDPQGITATWVGPDVCSYEGVFCSPPPNNQSDCETVVSGIDLNHANLTGTLPEELGLLKYLALFHLNSNFFTGPIPSSFKNLGLLYELDLSNNNFSGQFPHILLEIPTLGYLDVRFNNYSGTLPSQLFNIRTLDAIFVNNNRFVAQIPDNIGNSRVSVINLANSGIQGSIPPSIGNASATLNELNLLNNKLSGCIPPEIGALTQLNVFDVSFNLLGGTLPYTIANMINLVDLDVADNLLTGVIPKGICDLPNLQNFTFSDNFFFGESPDCLALPSRNVTVDNHENCIPFAPNQRSLEQCVAFLGWQPPSCYPKYVASIDSEVISPPISPTSLPASSDHESQLPPS